MIFGETTEQLDARMSSWQKKFVWYPVELEDGRIAFMETVLVKYEWKQGLYTRGRWWPEYKARDE